MDEAENDACNQESKSENHTWKVFRWQTANDRRSKKMAITELNRPNNNETTEYKLEALGFIILI